MISDHRVPDPDPPIRSIDLIARLMYELIQAWGHVGMIIAPVLSPVGAKYYKQGQRPCLD